MNPTLTVVERDAPSLRDQETFDLSDQSTFRAVVLGIRLALPLYPGDKRSTMISGSLPTVAGLSGDHRVTVLDENVEEIDWESLRGYDMVGVTGMNVQQRRIREILVKLRELNIFTVVGGPFVSVQEKFLRRSVRREIRWRGRNDLAALSDDYASGRPTRDRRASCPDRHGQAPRPRFDLLKVARYASARCSTRGLPIPM